MFGRVANGEMVLNDAGKMIAEQWNALPERFPNIDLDVYQIMPEHFHGVIVISGATLPAFPTKQPTLGEIIGAFKSITTNEYIKGVKHYDWPHFEKRLWQRNYYEHVVRDDTDMNRIRKYIQSNPANWDKKP